ncbi:MAG: hypothetical protein GY715_08230 [Planctomycetes bacterium]|nr:hypothetical protein [Planctomycetota bacterium]
MPVFLLVTISTHARDPAAPARAPADAPGPPIGACCFPDGTCVDGVTEADCINAGGLAWIENDQCSFIVCPDQQVCGPGAGDCFQSNGTPGCEDVECCETVCAIDPFCCDAIWDGMCVDHAFKTCVLTGPVACCFPDGSCHELTIDSCAHIGAVPQPPGTNCSNVLCEPASSCPPDLDGSGTVGFGDILVIIGAWGPCIGCPEDLNGNGAVDFGDILVVIGAWGPCPTIVLGACCIIDETICLDVWQAVCDTLDAVFSGEGPTCDTFNCGDATPVCDHCHNYSRNFNECLHWANDVNGAACSKKACINNIIDTDTCDHHDRTGNSTCENKTEKKPLGIQRLYAAKCPGGNVAWNLFETIYYDDCGDTCFAHALYDSCVTPNCKGKLLRGPDNRGKRKKCGCP